MAEDTPPPERPRLGKPVFEPGEDQADETSHGDALSGLETSTEDRISDAAFLLDYAVSAGAPVPEDVIAAIRTAQSGQIAGPRGLVDFETAYAALARLMHPVTAKSLRATERPPGVRAKSEAEQWSWFLWKWTLFVLVVIAASEAWSTLVTSFVPVDSLTDAEVFDEASRWNRAGTTILEIYLPFFYGALGACAYLIRRCHTLITNRTFNTLRKGEYLNRLLLGFVSGGVIGLFGEDLIESETLERLGTATAAFLAGYNVDFLFTAIERVVAALLPKVEPQTVPPEPPSEPPRPAGAQ